MCSFLNTMMTRQTLNTRLESWLLVKVKQFHQNWNSAFPADENLPPVGDGGGGGSGVSEAAFLIQKTRPQIVITFATGITSSCCHCHLQCHCPRHSCQSYQHSSDAFVIVIPVAIVNVIFNIFIDIVLNFSGFIASCLVYTLLTMTLPASSCTSTTSTARAFGNNPAGTSDTSSAGSSSRTLGIVTDKVETAGNVTSSIVSTKVKFDHWIRISWDIFSGVSRGVQGRREPPDLCPCSHLDSPDSAHHCKWPARHWCHTLVTQCSLCQVSHADIEFQIIRY